MHPLKKFFKDKEEKQDHKFLEALQVEPSSICNLKCSFCPTTHINHPEDKGIMSFDLFKTLEPYFAWAKWIYFEGWGEPLLNPDFWKMVSLAKEKGLKVAIRTNGTLFDPRNIANVFRYDVDLLSFSVAGANYMTHNKLRRFSHLNQIIYSLREILKIKKKKHSKNPNIKISYMLTTDTIEELPEAIKIAYDLGVDEFFTTNLDYVFNEEVLGKTLLSYKDDANPDYEKYILEAQDFASLHNFSFSPYPLKIEKELPVCDLNPNNYIFIASNGDVVPCSYLGRIENPRINPEETCSFKRKKFGNLKESNLEEIWNQTAYIDFRTNFALRFAVYQDLMLSLTDYSPSLQRIKDAESRYHKILAKNPVPKECRTCPKIYGI